MNLQNNKRNEVGHMIAHDSHLNQNTDPEKESLIDKEMTKLNKNLYERNDGLTDKEFIEKAIEESPTAEHWKSNYNAMSTWCIQIPKEFTGTYEERMEIFKEMVNFVGDRYGWENLISAWTHFDEVRNREGIEKENGKSLIPIKEREHCQDHIHIRFLPRTEDGRFSTKEVTPRKELRNFQRDMQQHLREKFPEHAHELNFLNGATKDKSKDLARQAELNHQNNLKEKEELKKELEKEIAEKENRLFDEKMKHTAEVAKKEKEIAEKEKEIAKTKEFYDNNSNTAYTIYEAAEKAKAIKNKNISMPEPDGKGLKKGTYSREQVEVLVTDLNKAYDQIRDLQQGKEIQKGFDTLEEKTRKANELIKQRTYEKTLEENKLLNRQLSSYEKEHDYVVWLDKNYNMSDIKKKYEKEKQQEREYEKEHTHTRSKEREEPSR